MKLQWQIFILGVMTGAFVYFGSGSAWYGGAAFFACGVVRLAALSIVEALKK
jgi:hypothetical protein